MSGHVTLIRGFVLNRFGIEFQEKHFLLFLFLCIVDIFFLLFILVCKAIVVTCLTFVCMEQRDIEKEEKIKYNNTYNRAEMSQQ